MPGYRNTLPQLAGDIFLTDAGVKTDLIFNHGIEIREFAAHTLLPDPVGKQALIDYFRGFLLLAREHNTGYILDSVTWKAHMHWAEDLGASEQDLQEANKASIALISQLRDEFSSNASRLSLMVLSARKVMPMLQSQRLLSISQSNITPNRLVG